MAAPTVYRSSDASAPVLTGTAGDLINLLDKCLVSGYGSKSAAGWSRKTAFAGANSTRAVFQQGGGNSFYLDVDDRGASSPLTGASGKEAAIRGYEAMTDVSTGTNPFPTTGQQAAATANWRKSATADAVPRGWFLIADDRSFILGVLTQDTANQYQIAIFGDIYSTKTGDGYRTGIWVRTAVNSASGSAGFGQFSTTLISSATGFYVARTAAQTGTSVNLGCSILGSSPEGTISLINQAANGDGNVYLSRMMVGDQTSAVLRGWLRGLYEILTPIGLNDGDTFSGAGDFAGRTFVVVRGLISNGSFCIAVETTAWDTSS